MVSFNRMTLPVRDWRAARDWYVTHLGFAAEWQNPDVGLACVADDTGMKIFLVQAEPAASPSLAFAIEVDDVEETHRRMSAAGVAFAHDPQKTFWGYGAELRDPSGYVLRLWDAVTMQEKS